MKDREGSWRKVFPGSLFQGKKGILLLAVTLAALLLLNLDAFLGGVQDEIPEPVTREPADQGVGNPEREMARELERILSAVAGTGRVEVLLTLEGGAKYEYAGTSDMMKKETLEQDTAGGTREIRESTEGSQLVIVRSSQGHEEPVLIRKTFPPVQGVVVVAQGAQKPGVKESLTRAVQTVLGIGPHKVTVLPMDNREELE